MEAGQEPKLPEDYQILIKVKVAGGVPIDISYVTRHVLSVEWTFFSANSSSKATSNSRAEKKTLRFADDGRIFTRNKLRWAPQKTVL